MSRLRKVLSVSNVIAFAALFVALGGSVYAAGKISGSQVKPNSLPGNRVKAKTLTAKQIKPGSLTGTQIKAGSLTATQINQATLTGVTASKVGSIQYAVATVPLSGGGSGVTATPSCPSGTNVVGGGAILSNPLLAIVNESAPSPSRNGWIATGFGEVGTTMTVTAICTAAASVSG